MRWWLDKVVVGCYSVCYRRFLWNDFSRSFLYFLSCDFLSLTTFTLRVFFYSASVLINAEVYPKCCAYFRSFGSIGDLSFRNTRKSAHRLGYESYKFLPFNQLLGKS